MKTENEIIKEAKEAYEKNFIDAHEVKNTKEKEDDVVLDQDKLFDEVEKLKDQEITKHASLEVLREQLEEEAKEALDTISKDEREVPMHKKMTTDEMEEELMEEKNEMLDKFDQLKHKQMMK